MRLDAVKILEFPITKNSKKHILEFLKKYLQKNSKFKIQNSKLGIKPLVIVTPNPEQIVYAQTDKHFARILKQADITIPDGVGVVWASRFLNPQPLTERITGVELMENLVKMAAKEGFPVGLIGGRGGVALRALECLRKKYPGVVGWSEEGPEIRMVNSQWSMVNGGEKTEKYFEDLARKINENGTRAVFVGLGAPKQEYFIEKLKVQMSNVKIDKTIILMSVGGASDFIAGNVARAPLWIRSVGLEWLWRLVRQPWRLSRQFVLVRFIFLVVKERLRI